MRRSVRGPSEMGRQRDQGPYTLTQTSPSPHEGSLSMVPVRKTTKRHCYLLGTRQGVWRTNERGGPAPDTSSALHTTGKGVRRQRTELPTRPLPFLRPPVPRPGPAAGSLPARSPALPIRMESSVSGRSSLGPSASDFFINAGSKFRARAVWGSSAAP